MRPRTGFQFEHKIIYGRGGEGETAIYKRNLKRIVGAEGAVDKSTLICGTPCANS